MTPPLTFPDDSDMEGEIGLRWQGLLVGGSSPKDPDVLASLPSFIGSVQRFTMNNVDYFGLAKISTNGRECAAFFFLISLVSSLVRSSLWMFRSEQSGSTCVKNAFARDCSSPPHGRPERRVYD